jgi:hypothetical protein
MERQSGRNKQFGKSRRKARNLIVLSAIPAIAGLAVWGWIGSSSHSPELPSGPATTVYELRETRTPLSPALFVGQTARAYEIAHEIPHVLDQLYCYCECDKHLGHHSLLSCFIDSHAAT